MDYDDEDDRKLPAAAAIKRHHHDDDAKSDGSKIPSKKIKKEPSNSAIIKTNLNDDDDDEVQVVSPDEATPRKLYPTTAASLPVVTGVENDDDVEFVGATGKNTLVDFPHAREYCLVHPFKQDPKLSCTNCYCYVCDKQVSDCQVWQSEHCHATHTSSKWRQERHNKANPIATAAAATTATTTTTTSTIPSYSRPRQQKHPVKQLLDAVTRIYPSEVTPLSPPFVTDLKHYQKQSLAFMMDVEKNYQKKSGWICSDVGMGKSAIVIAAIINNPMSHKQNHPTSQQIKDARFGGSTDSSKKGLLNVKGTIIFTTKSLLGQWEDEIQKHAPDSLRVYRVHGKSTKLKLADLADADVIITTSTVSWGNVFKRHYKYHRLVVDESHLFGTGSSARLDNVIDFVSDHRWCVTATPMCSSVKDLNKQIEFLHLANEKSMTSSVESFLKKYMIRHTKSQQINGSVALMLPESTTTIKMVPMTGWERKTFDTTSRHKNRCLWRGTYHGSQEKSVRIVEMSWYSPIIKSIACEDSSKCEYLKQDLQALLAQEPNMRAVVYSQFIEQHKFATKAVKSLGLKTYGFDGSKTSEKRDQYIREFQSLDSTGPAVFLVTLKAGSVGITLTAASHVFLLEPCIDPATEVQAAGRIHRLGQTKRVGVTKYVFENSIESNILKLHEKLKTGDIEYTTGMLTRGAISILDGGGGGSDNQRYSSNHHRSEQRRPYYHHQSLAAAAAAATAAADDDGQYTDDSDDGRRECIIS